MPELLTRTETPRDSITSEGGVRVDLTSEAAVRHLIRPRNPEVPYTLEPPEPRSALRSFATGAIATLLAIVLSATVGFAAGWISVRWPF